MDFRFTKYSFINALWSLIPIFPTWTLFPGLLAAMGLEKITSNCETGYLIVLWFSAVTVIGMMVFYGYRLDNILLKTESEVKRNFRFYSLIIYTLSNTVLLITLLGVDLACYGDGQTLLMCIFSGPLASLVLIAFGFLLDLK
ncbi:hypothetical protein ACNQGO_13175 [Flavobacterium sp. ZT3P35]|uniref:hypothetical protein n=2 Tax=unclassified Flavobacterium TaxID=196869 RepID=UPI003AACED6F